MGLEIGQLPKTIGSPVAAIEEKNRVLTGQILWDMKRGALDSLNVVFREPVTDVKLLSHDNSSIFK